MPVSLDLPAPPLASPLRVALGAALLLAIGLAVVAAARGGFGGWRAGGWRAGGWRRGLGRCVEELALAVAAGPAVAAPLLLAAGLLGLPARGRPMTLLLGGLALAGGGLAWAASRRRGPDVVPAPAAAAPAQPFLLWAGRLTLAAALLVALAKIALVRLWSWDHYAIWGLKARWIAAEGSLGADLLARFDPQLTVADYPLGVPLAWVAATLGALPTAPLVAAVHAAWLVALVALVHAAARRLSASPPVALAAAAFVAASPLAWDSTHLGGADLPLALGAVAAVAAALPALTAGETAGRGRLGHWALCGLLLGFLPWVKTEGASLAVLLALALAAWRWWFGGEGRTVGPVGHQAADFARELAAMALPAALVGGAALAVRRLLLPPARSFFDGAAAERFARRLADPLEVLAPVTADLAGLAWLGAWLALPLVLLAAARRRRGPALALAAVATAQLAVYLAVFFATYLEVDDHVATALHRIAAVLVPLAALAAAALAAPDSRRIHP